MYSSNNAGKQAPRERNRASQMNKPEHIVISTKQLEMAEFPVTAPQGSKYKWEVEIAPNPWRDVTPNIKGHDKATLMFKALLNLDGRRYRCLITPPTGNSYYSETFVLNVIPLENERKTKISDEVVIEFSHVTKTYRLYKNDRERFFGYFKRKTGSHSSRNINANADLSFTIKRGEGVAFLGQNGAGKSTLLKIITGVTTPTSGTASVNGEVSALLELQAGFDRNLTGRENIDLRGQVMGMSKSQIEAIKPGIIEFSGLGVYIDQPLSTYSSGMLARLGFSFAVATDPDILIIDEALSVGDRAFRNRCLDRVKEIMSNEQVTVLFVTHSLAMAKKFCSRGIVMYRGRKIFDGGIDRAVEFYQKYF